MNLQPIEEQYRTALENQGDFSEHLKLKKLLLSDNSEMMLNYHYELLRQRADYDLYLDLRAFFMDRPDIESFLIEKLKTEQDLVMQADILQILGTIKSPHALQLAHDFINHDNQRHREVASFVIGWSGTRDDIALLQDHMLNEQDPQMRITAASAQRQMAWRHPELKYPILKSLQKGFETEKDDEVLSWIIVMIGTIAVKPLGIREDRDDPDVLHGDLSKAKKRTRAFLDTLG